MQPNSGLRGAGSAGTSFATGLPRLVITIGLRVLAISSMSFRHLALNSAAEISMVAPFMTICNSHETTLTQLAPQVARSAARNCAWPVLRADRRALAQPKFPAQHGGNPRIERRRLSRPVELHLRDQCFNRL